MFYPKDFPKININEEFRLREQRFSDTEDFFSYIKNQNVKQYILAPIPENIKEAQEDIIYWIDLFYKRTGIYWSICETKTDKMIGAIGFHDINPVNNRAEISYDLSENYWRKGIMNLAMKKVIDYGFNTLKLERIQASTIKENIASIKLLEKNNFKFEGTLRHHRKHRGKYYNIEMYSILKND